MMKLTVYAYSGCSTCRNALKWLREHGHTIEEIPIREQPPSAPELKDLIAKSGLEIKKWFNVSGSVYRELGLKDKLPEMKDEEKIALLASNGMLLKRPIVTDGERVTVGFKEEEFQRVWGSGSSF
ncbi:arsenate reductase family protein [Insulibacter thermoxylanivorax]|uniref:arsenate reductase family protein n=1 Tax=Insulibacter thermoxylanivorax TaxID=2749268 RepID=UPI0019108E00|nr:arsenate reductase family protein [Insulibacter thermoxylanivorax]